MIRSITAVFLIIAAIFGLMIGVHPVWSIIYCVVGMFLIGWVCVEKFEDEPQLGN